MWICTATANNQNLPDQNTVGLYETWTGKAVL